jgi:hypothetical protein
MRGNFLACASVNDRLRFLQEIQIRSESCSPDHRRTEHIPMNRVALIHVVLMLEDRLVHYRLSTLAGAALSSIQLKFYAGSEN